MAENTSAVFMSICIIYCKGFLHTSEGDIDISEVCKVAVYINDNHFLYVPINSLLNAICTCNTRLAKTHAST